MAKPSSDRLTPAQFNKYSDEAKEKFVNKLKDYYFIQNLSRDEVLNVMNITISTLKHVMKLYNLKKDKALVQKNVNKTLLSKYGRTGWANREKIKETMLEKYGVDNPLKSEVIKEKVKSTNNKRYGGNAPACSSEVQAKMQNTCLERYGVDNIRKSSIHKQKIVENMSKTIQEKYGVPYYCLTKDCISHQGKTISKVNLKFAKLLEKNNIEYELEYVLENRAYDFKVNNYLIEINPAYTHNSTIGPYINGNLLDGKDINYHLDKTLLASKYNFQCIHVFENDNWDKIINLINPNKYKLGGRLCEIREVSLKECNMFLNTYHLQNTCKNQSIRLGLYYHDELIQIMTFGKPRYNKNYEYELLRLCTHSDYTIIGGSKKLWNHFINNWFPTSIISYCDNSKFLGNVYTELGMKYSELTKPVGNWYNLCGNDNRLYISDSLLRQRGFDQIFNTSYGKGTSNTQLMIEHGWVQLYNCGQKIFTYNIKI